MAGKEARREIGRQPRREARGQRPSQAKEGKTVTTQLCSGLMRKHTLFSATSALNCLTLALSLTTGQHDLQMSLATLGLAVTLCKIQTF